MKTIMKNLLTALLAGAVLRLVPVRAGESQRRTDRGRPPPARGRHPPRGGGLLRGRGRLSARSGLSARHITAFRWIPTRYTVSYEVFASNLMPDITVLETASHETIQQNTNSMSGLFGAAAARRVRRVHPVGAADRRAHATSGSPNGSDRRLRRGALPRSTLRQRCGRRTARAAFLPARFDAGDGCR